MAQPIRRSRRRPYRAARRVSWAVSAVLAIAGSAFGASSGAEPVAELFEKNCAECHSEKVKTSGFSVGSLDAVIKGGNKHGRAVIAGHPENSPLIKLLKGDLAPRM